MLAFTHFYVPNCVLDFWIYNFEYFIKGKWHLLKFVVKFYIVKGIYNLKKKNILSQKDEAFLTF